MFESMRVYVHSMCVRALPPTMDDDDANKNTRNNDDDDDAYRFKRPGTGSSHGHSELALN